MGSFQVRAVLQRLGADIRTARLRRRLSVADFCQRIGVTDKTLAKLERGDGGVRLETLAAALLALGELHRLESLLDPAGDDTGLGLDRNRLPKRIATPRRRPVASAVRGTVSDDPAGGRIDDPADEEGSAF